MRFGYFVVIAISTTSWAQSPDFSQFPGRIDPGAKSVARRGLQPQQAELAVATRKIQGLSGLLQAIKMRKDLTLEEVRHELHGEDYLHPAAESLIGQFIAETHAPTIIRKFWRAPKYSINPPHVKGPERLVIGVKEKDFSIFKKYFGSKHFLFLLNVHGNFVAFKNRQSVYPGDYWQGQILGEDIEFPGEGHIITPMLLSSTEGARAENYFALARYKDSDGTDGALARFPWRFYTKGGDASYCSESGYGTGCGTWIANMPIGDKLVNEYYFASGDEDEKSAFHDRLRRYVLPDGIKEGSPVGKLIRKVWTVPGHQQLGEILSAGANRRGEFDNAGWTSLTFLGSAKTDRVPYVFYFMRDRDTKIDPDFPLLFEEAD